ncbi:hypothetical protein BC830DRAFT_1169682 [Chytriomyces sp. MP71]|nr:hypothetical protein BC830DRAFT_1169682 [Chytriomyces sp. MP71]
MQAVAGFDSASEGLCERIECDRRYIVLADGPEAQAVGAEKQGVAGTMRIGQTKTVKIVRFVVKNTVEQEMHNRRKEMFTLNYVV